MDHVAFAPKNDVSLAVLEVSVFPLALCDRELKVVWANPAFERLVGVPRGALLGRPVWEPDSSSGSERYRGSVKAALAGIPGGWIQASYASRGAEPGAAELWLSVIEPGLTGGRREFLVQGRDLGPERRLRARMEQRLQLRTAFAESSEAMLRSSTPQELWQSACDVAVTHGGLKMAWVGAVNESTGWVELVASSGAGRHYLSGLRISADDRIAEGRGPVGQALRTGKPCIFQDVFSEPLFAPWRARAQNAEFRSVAALPLAPTAGMRVVLSVFSELPEFFDDEALPLLTRVASNVGLAWEAMERRRREAEVHEELVRANERFERAFQQSGVASALLDPQLHFLHVNRAMAGLLAAEGSELVGSLLTDFIEPADRRLVRRQLARREKTTEAGVLAQPRIRRRDGQTGWVLASGASLPATSSQPEAIVWQAQDITAQRRAEQEAEVRSAQQAAVARLGGSALSAQSLDELIQEAARIAAEQLNSELSGVLELKPGGQSLRLVAGLGWKPGLVGTAVISARPGSQVGQMLATAAPVIVRDLRSEPQFSGSALLQAHHVRSGLIVPIKAGTAPWGAISAHTREVRQFTEDDLNFLSGVALVLGAAISREAAEEELQRQALHDPLTGLPNRVLILDRIEQALARLRRRGKGLAVMFLDVDRFKVVNDSMGHAAGDAVLREIASRLQAAVRPSDTVGRVGGDEFVILCEEAGADAQVRELAERIVSVVDAPIEIGAEEVIVSASVGLAVARTAGAGPEELVREADLSMYQAKRQGGRRWVRFDRSMRANVAERVHAETELRRGMAREEFVLHYQPIVEVSTGCLVGAEALIRWDRPGVGLVPPNQFIPLAEETGAIVEIGAWAMQRACLAAAAWTAQRPERPLRLSVNLSARQLHDPDLPRTVIDAIERSGLTPGQLCLEITETAMMVDSKAAVARLAALKEIGVMIALDDFGTGYSSISHLKRFSLDQLKIDKSFVDGVDLNGRDVAIVDGLIKLAHAMGLEVAAEGVERRRQLVALRSLDCDLVQGFLLSRPVDAERFEGLWALGSSAAGRAGL